MLRFIDAPLEGQFRGKGFLDNLIVGAPAGGGTPGVNAFVAALILETGTVAVGVPVATGVG